MLLKKFEAPTVEQALEEVARECGPDALVVETRRRSGRYVVLAAKDPAPAQARRRPRAHRRGRERPERWTRGFAPLARAARERGLSREVLATIERAMVGTAVELSREGDPAIPAIAGRILKALIETEPLRLPEFRVTALVGPTGVGKTTTLAKLAARARRDADEEVGIVTLDTYRIAAVDQLRAFADMLGVPMVVAFTPADLQRAVRELAACDRILVDTTGRGPFDREALENLRATLQGGGVASVLCLPAGVRRVDAEATLEAYEALRPRRVVLTKWDETRVPGEALSVLVERGLVLSHVTIGQEVPGDIVRADAGVLAASMLGLDEEQAEVLW